MVVLDEWGDYLEAARKGLWQTVIRPALDPVWHNGLHYGDFQALSPALRTQLLDVALQQGRWDYVVILVNQGFGLDQLPAIISAAFCQHQYSAVRDILYDRPSIFDAALLTRMLKELIEPLHEWKMAGQIFSLCPNLSARVDEELFELALQAYTDTPELEANGNTDPSTVVSDEELVVDNDNTTLQVLNTETNDNGDLQRLRPETNNNCEVPLVNTSMDIDNESQLGQLDTVQGSTVQLSEGRQDRVQASETTAHPDEMKKRANELAQKWSFIFSCFFAYGKSSPEENPQVKDKNVNEQKKDTPEIQVDSSGVYDRLGPSESKVEKSVAEKSVVEKVKPSPIDTTCNAGPAEEEGEATRAQQRVAKKGCIYQSRKKVACREFFHDCQTYSQQGVLWSTLAQFYPRIPVDLQHEFFSVLVQREDWLLAAVVVCRQYSDWIQEQLLGRARKARLESELAKVRCWKTTLQDAATAKNRFDVLNALWVLGEPTDTKVKKTFSRRRR